MFYTLICSAVSLKVRTKRKWFVKKNEYLTQGIYLKTNRRASRVIVTLHGRVHYTRTVLIPADVESKRILFEREHRKNVIPLDELLGISRLPFKMTVGLMLACAYWAQNQTSYEKAEEALYTATNIHVNDDTIRQVTNFIGKIVFDEDCRRAEEIFKKYDSGQLEFKKRTKGVLYIEAYGAALNTRHKNEDGSSWRENKLGVVFSSDHICYWTDTTGQCQQHIEQCEYISCIGGADTFKRQLFACAYRNGYGRFKNTVILSDGAEWSAHMAEELFPDAQRILDLFYLKEHVYDFAKCKFSQNENRYTPWAKNICERLENGEWKSVLSELDPEEKYANCVNLYHYIDVNRNAINYPEYKKKGFFVGNGADECENKVVLQSRLKQAGMRWEAETAQFLLTLRAKKESNLWRQDVIGTVRHYFG